jgi:nucleoside-diphosphate-sugar epimerase
MAVLLVTGGAGFVATHVIQQALAAGHQVRASLRDPRRGEELRQALQAAGAVNLDQLSFVAADLGADAGWAQAAAGCDFVHHVASPFPAAPPKDEAAIIGPAREGALRVLRAARDAGVKRVVLTSSVVAITQGHAAMDAAYDETQWTDVNGPNVTAYARSKTLAERAAWDFMAREGGELELSVVNPDAIFGPLITPQISTSILLVKQMLEGAMPAVPRLWMGAVDVRDVADLHLRAMTAPQAKGERFIAVAGPPLSMAQIAAVLKARGGPRAAKISTKEAPDWLLKLIGRFNPMLGDVVPDLNRVKRTNSGKAQRVLGWAPHSTEEALLATADSLERLGLLKAA